MHDGWGNPAIAPPGGLVISRPTPATPPGPAERFQAEAAVRAAPGRRRFPRSAGMAYDGPVKRGPAPHHALERAMMKGSRTVFFTVFRGACAWLLVVLACVAALSGCRRRSEIPPPGIPFATTTTSPKLSTFVFKEEGRTYLMTVGVNATRFHDADAFIPLTVVLANKAGARMMITRESFTLIDPVSGARYGLASVAEVRVQGKQLYDRQLMDADHFGTKLDPFVRVPSNFFPYQEIVSDEFELHSFQYMADNLYFPRPEGQLLGKTFELHLSARGLDQNLFVVFTIPEK